MRDAGWVVPAPPRIPHPASRIPLMLNVALTGNIAAGKSTIVDLFRRWGATIIDADVLVREAQAPGERKRAKSDLVIENEGSLEQLERQARAAFDELRHRAAVAALGGRPARVLLLAAAGTREQPTLNPIAARYADAGLAVRRVTGDAAAIERALGQPATPDAIVATAAAAAAAEQAWADAGRPGVLTSPSEGPDPVAVRLDLRPWGAGRVLLVEPGAAGLAPRSDLFPSANPLP